jgi:hypothetical protein
MPTVTDVLSRPTPRAAVAVGLTLSALGVVLGLCLLLFTERAASFLEPLALQFDDDGVLVPENWSALLRVIQALGALMLAAVGGLLALGWTWESLGARLPAVQSTPTATRRAPSIWDAAALLVAAIALVWLVVRVWHRSLGYDEIVTVVDFVDAPGWWDTFTRNSVFNNHVPYSALARISRSLLGVDEWAVRLPALVLGLASLPVVWWLGTLIFDFRTSRIAVLLLAVSPLFVEYNAAARGYTGLLLFGALSTCLFLSALERRRVAALAGYLIASAIAIWFHLYGVFVLAGQALYLIYLALRFPATLTRSTFRLLLLCMIGAALTAGLLMAPLLPRIVLEIQRRGAGVFQPAFPWEVALVLSGGVLWVLALAAIGVAMSLRRRQPVTVLAVLVAGVSMLLPWILKPFDLYHRFFVFLLPFWALFVAYPLVVAAKAAAAWRASPGLGRTVLVIATAAIVATLAHRARTSVEEEGFRSAGAAMLDRASDDTIFVAIGSGGFLTSYYIARPLAMPETLEDFLEVTHDAREVRVVYRRSTRVEVDDDPIMLFLEDRAESVRFGRMTVYRWRPD